VAALLAAKNSEGGPRININATDANGDTAMHLAANHFSIEIVKALFTFGADANIRNKDGLTPLHLIVMTTDVEVLRSFFLAEKVVRESNRSNVMHVKSSESTIQHFSPIYLTKSMRSGLWPSIDLNIRDNRGRTSLHTAASMAFVDAADVLISNGAFPHIRDSEGNSILYLALLTTDEEVAKSNGVKDAFVRFATMLADLAAENKNGTRVWDLACAQKNFHLISLMTQSDLRDCRYKTLLTSPEGRQLLFDAIDGNEWPFVRTILSSQNRTHNGRDLHLYSQAKLHFGSKRTYKGFRHEAKVWDILSSWLAAYQNNSFAEMTIGDQLRDLSSQNCDLDLELAYSLFKSVNAAAGYRAICALSQSLSKSLQAHDVTGEVLLRIGNCWCRDRIPDDFRGCG
jgi:hypothetical protein